MNLRKEFSKLWEIIIYKKKKKKLSIYKKKLIILFKELYQYEKINEKMIEEFKRIIQKTANNKELNKMNYMIIGSSGVGKSTLINALFGENVAEEGSGKRCTTIGTKKTRGRNWTK